MIELILAATIHYLPGDWNERHPGIRYERAPFMAAAFHNSEGDLSLAAGLVGRHEIAPGVNLFGELAIVTGYEAAPIVPMVRAGLEAGRTRFFVAPAAKADGKFGALIGAELIIARW